MGRMSLIELVQQTYDYICSSQIYCNKDQSLHCCQSVCQYICIHVPVCLLVCLSVCDYLSVFLTARTYYILLVCLLMFTCLRLRCLHVAYMFFMKFVEFCY